MSRTFRRNKTHCIHRHLGNFDEYLFSEVRFELEYHHQRMEDVLTPERVDTVLADYMRSVTRYTSDGRRYGVPRSYRHYHGSVLFRASEKQKQYNAQKYDSWDAHLHPRFPNNAAWYYW